jgi:opacity protein-like surface antigen
MRIHCVLPAALAAAMLIPAAGEAQTFQARKVEPEIFGSVASARLFRFEDQAFGNDLNLGIGLGVRVARFGFEFELNRMLGLTPAPAPCGIARCIGSAQEGVRSATIASGNALYYFSDSRIQPYVTGGIGALRTRSVSSILFARDNVGTFSEREEADTGLALNAGAGVRIVVNDVLAIRPEIRMYDSSVQSRQNLAMIRTSIGASVRW